VRIANNNAVDPDGDTLGVMDRALDAALQDYVFVSGELALENEGFAQDGDLPGGARGRGGGRSLHRAGGRRL
jgi:hypothetical protein